MAVQEIVINKQRNLEKIKTIDNMAEKTVQETVINKPKNLKKIKKIDNIFDKFSATSIQVNVIRKEKIIPL